MKVRVLKRFKDKYTKEVYEVGQYLDIDQRRVDEINSTRFGILVEVEYAQLNLDSMTKKELVEYAQSKGIELDMKMTKKEMIEELV